MGPVVTISNVSPSMMKDASILPEPLSTGQPNWERAKQDSECARSFSLHNRYGGFLLSLVPSHPVVISLVRALVLDTDSIALMDSTI